MSHTYIISRPNPKLLSIVMPLYNEEEIFSLLRPQLTHFLDSSPYACEVIAVNDGSSDRTIDFLVEWSASDPRIKVLNLSRNFGHQYASTAGIDHASGDAVVLIDGDLQDPLEVIHQMVAQYRNGYDVVCGQRVARTGESVFKRFTAWAFYRGMRVFFLKSLPQDVGDFRLMSRRCVDSLTAMREMHRFLRGMVAWVGYPQTCVYYERNARAAGTTKYPLGKMLRLAWTAVVSFSPLPLRISFVGGGMMTLLALEEAVRALFAYFSGKAVPGWTSLMVVLCLSNAALMMVVGILGEYVGRIYEEGKSRPLYLVADKWNFSSTQGISPVIFQKALTDIERLESISAGELISH
ncbi:glycosyltransferase family 2 protein [Acidobacterium sp. S8]|uniref:glycosyltransferase family 2 protein n=1 Tax=Acidobacterium sp. S8 TaxID=1641854 RepID=UPI00131E347D|nr:glycosyltransferase family 2 protein [Acidobacterium sp. S8]